MKIFLDDVDYRKFVYLLGDITEQFEIECWNYCLMPNHYHVTLRPTHANLSEAVRRLNSVYGGWWNRRHERVGHVFQGRFKDQVVDRESYLLALSRYVVMNPVRAGLVGQPGDWAWSSYRATTGVAAAPAFLSTRSTLSLFGDAPDEVLQTWFADAMTAPGDDSISDRIRSNERVLGSRRFKDFVSESVAGLTPV